MVSVKVFLKESRWWKYLWNMLCDKMVCEKMSKIVDGTGDKNCLWKMVSDSKILWEKLICKNEYKIKLGDGRDDKHDERKIDLRKFIFS
jgi:hypothetical protein